MVRIGEIFNRNSMESIPPVEKIEKKEGIGKEKPKDFQEYVPKKKKETDGKLGTNVDIEI